MMRTLFYVPDQISCLPIFGWGLAATIWALVSALWLWRIVRAEGWTADATGHFVTSLLVGAFLVFVIPLVVEPIEPGAWIVPPVAATAGVPIRGYGAMLLLAVVSGVGLAMWRARSAGLSSDVIASLAMHMVIGGIVGARILFVWQYWDDLKGDTWFASLANVLSFNRGGLVVYGALFGAALAFIRFCEIHRMAPLPLADLIAPSLALGLAWGRIGCLLNGCCFGGPSDVAWAVTFPLGSPPYEAQKERGLLYGLNLDADNAQRPVIRSVLPGSSLAGQDIPPGTRIVALDGRPTPTWVEAQRHLFAAGPQVRLTLEDGRNLTVELPRLPPRSLPVQPTQIYSAANALCLSLLALAYYPVRRRHGEVIGLLLTAYAVTRFLLERIRVDEGAIWSVFTISETISLGLGAAMVVYWGWLWTRPRLPVAS